VPELSRDAGELFAPPSAKGESFLASALREDLCLTSIPKLLHYEDRNSMAHGIEARVPFLDHRVVEFCLRLPPGVRIEAGVTKAPLRRALADLLPAMVANRLDKKGFPEPLGNWIAGTAHAAVADILLSDRARARGLFRSDRIEAALREHRAGASRTVPLYRALTLELWFRLFQDREGFERFGVLPPPTASRILTIHPRT
jgi:asparagine synthase (glutamine-hydrolysing)